MGPLLIRALRIAALGYMAMLVLAALPAACFPDGSGLRIARTHATAAFYRVGLTPGHVIFTGSPTEWKIASNCLRVSGETPDGRRVEVYDHECPGRRGLRLYNRPFDQALQEMTRVQVRVPLEETSATAARWQDIAAYFCHSPLEDHPRFSKVHISQTVHVRSARSGERLRNAELFCSMPCMTPRPVIPTCRYRGRPEPVPQPDGRDG